MFKIIEKCPLCGSKKKSRIITNTRNVYSYFLSKILNKSESYVLENMSNFKCSNCTLIYKKKWPKEKYIKKIYTEYQISHPGGLNTLKKNFGKNKFISLIKNYKYFYLKNSSELCEKTKRELIKLLNSTDNIQKKFIILRNKFIKNLNTNNINYLNNNYLNLSKMINKPKVYSQFCGFRSEEILKYFNQTINLKKIKSYAEIGCPLWGNYDYFKKKWIKLYFVNLNEVNFWKIDRSQKDNCVKYLPKNIKLKSKDNLNNVDFVGIYNFLDHLEYPLKLFKNVFKKTNYYGIICEDYYLSKKVDCQHFSSWNFKSLTMLSKKIGFKIHNKPIRLGNSIYKLYIFKKKQYEKKNNSF